MARENKSTKESLSSGIVSFLRQRGMTLKRIGETIRCSESFVCRVGKGERSFTVEHLTQLEKNLGAPLPLLLLEARHKDSGDKRMRSSYEDLRGLLKNSAKTRASLFGEEVDCPIMAGAMDRGTKGPSRTSMGNVLVVCPDEVRLRRQVRSFSKRGGDLCRVTAYANTADVKGEVRGDRESVRVIILNLSQGSDPLWDLFVLRRQFANARVIVVMDADDPERAFDMLRAGAFDVVMETADLRETITRAASGAERPYGKLLEVSRPQREWGFMSMTFDPRDENHDDYWLAIKPAMLQLRLGLHRLDELAIRPRGPDLRAGIIKAIREHKVVVAQLSSYTPNTAWEIGVADAQNKTIIPLRRRSSQQPIPEVLKGLIRIEYSSRTELALKLFYGLGGNMSDLRKTPKTWLGGWDNCE